jgi:hypothetical protein
MTAPKTIEELKREIRAQLARLDATLATLAKRIEEIVK